MREGESGVFSDVLRVYWNPKEHKRQTEQKAIVNG